MKKLILLVLAFILTACAPSEAAIQTSIAKTQTAMPTSTPTPTPMPTQTPTPTPIPLSKINLDNILLVDGDLPNGFSKMPIGRYTNNPVLGEISGQEQMVVQEFSKVNEGKGLVAVYLFQDTVKLNQAYNIAKGELDSMGNWKVSETNAIGEKGFLYFKYVFGKITFSAIIFVRCHAFVYIVRTMDDENSSVLKTYAKNLDKRLNQVICP